MVQYVYELFPKSYFSIKILFRFSNTNELTLLMLLLFSLSLIAFTWFVYYFSIKLLLSWPSFWTNCSLSAISVYTVGVYALWIYMTVLWAMWARVNCYRLMPCTCAHLQRVHCTKLDSIQYICYGFGGFYSRGLLISSFQLRALACRALSWILCAYSINVCNCEGHPWVFIRVLQ